MVALASPKINVLLLENVHPSALETFGAHGFHVETRAGALKEDELVAALPGVHLLGIRSKTRLTPRPTPRLPPRALAAGDSLLSVGCFCIGTNQVDLKEANLRGVPVFNAPFSN